MTSPLVEHLVGLRRNPNARLEFSCAEFRTRGLVAQALEASGLSPIRGVDRTRLPRNPSPAHSIIFDWGQGAIAVGPASSDRVARPALEELSI